MTLTYHLKTVLLSKVQNKNEKSVVLYIKGFFIHSKHLMILLLEPIHTWSNLGMKYLIFTVLYIGKINICTKMLNRHFTN